VAGLRGGECSRLSPCARGRRQLSGAPIACPKDLRARDAALVGMPHTRGQVSLQFIASGLCLHVAHLHGFRHAQCRHPVGFPDGLRSDPPCHRVREDDLGHPIRSCSLASLAASWCCRTTCLPEW